jgi:Protein kinase domain
MSSLTTTPQPIQGLTPYPPEQRVPLPVWTLALLALAFAKIAVAGVASTVSHATAPPTLFPLWINVAHMLIFGGTATLLIAGGRDARSRDLGCYFLLFASSFSDRLLLSLPDAVPGSGPAVTVLRGLHPDAFLPVYLWRFFRDFPTVLTFRRGDRLADTFIRISATASVVLFVANAWPSIATVLFGHGPGVPQMLSRSAAAGHYWTVVTFLILPAFPFAIWKMRFARPSERRRVRLFLAGLFVGSLPILVDVLMESLIPSFRQLMADPAARRISGFIVYPFLLSIPLTTAYAVLVDHVLDVRLVLRKALQHALGRYSVLALVAVPFVVLLWFLYAHRDEPISAVFQGNRVLVLAALVAFAAWMARVRRPLHDALDRRFFREQYDSRATLSSLVDRSRAATTMEELAALLESEIDRALHLEHLVVFLAEPARGQYAALHGRMPPLVSTSGLTTLLAGSPEPLDIDLKNPRSPLRRLPAADAEWLAECRFRLLMPLLGSGDALLGFVGLGEKRSELPFSREDRLLLAAIAASGALTLENRLMRSTPGDVFAAERPRLPGVHPDVSGEEPAVQCARCRAVSDASNQQCPSCGGPVDPAPVPYTLAGKFRLERHVGSGGMGVVYKALDLDLQRPVAIKTLPRLSPEHTARLRREARAMARVMHPNLALIFGAETWRGVPMLIFEFLEGGTLADRLAIERLSPPEAIDLGLVLADVLQHVHEAGVLHRDVKPNNIGFTRRRSPKLLDFGLAHLLDVVGQGPLPTRSTTDVVTTSLSVIAHAQSAEGRIVGTPLYLSPEAVAGERPQPSFDIWSLTIVLYESIAGKHPVAGRNVFETLDLITRCEIPDITGLRPDCPAPLAQFFRRALSQDARARPSTARDLTERLHAVRDALGA